MRKLACCSLLVLIAATAAAGGYGWWRAKGLFEAYQSYLGEAREVEVKPGSGGREILELLEREGVLADALAARIYLVYWLGDPPLQAGHYRFEGPLTALQVLDKLIDGDVVTGEVTVVEGLTLRETAEALAGAGLGDLDRFLEAMGDPSPIADLDPAATDLEGYLFPDTYRFHRGTSEHEIVAALAGAFRSRYQKDVAPLLETATNEGGEDAEPPPPSVREVVTLASIVEKEARLPEERALISGVYRNRLQRGIALYADPTVIYALKRRGQWNGNLRRSDLAFDSPYNTYRYPGLPPGPIASPGLASLRAAAAPAAVPYLYFVSRNDGSHVFAATLSEHNKNVDRWQRQYWRERWARERADSGGER
jgi:UPF0755 protein